MTEFLDRMLSAADPVRGADARTTVREVLDAASDEVSGGALAGQPLVEAEVRRSMGSAYLNLGLMDRAEEHFEAALALLEATPEVADLDRATVLDALGQLRRAQGNAPAAVTLYQHAMALVDSAGVAGDADAGERTMNDLRNDLGLALRDVDRIDEAAEVLEALAASERRLLSPDDVDLATTLNNLALVKRAQGDLDGAIGLFEEALGVLHAAFGERHVYIAAVLESIGSLEQLRGDHSTADRMMQQSLAMRRDILGGSHPDIVNGLNGLGLLHLEMGDLDAAGAYLDDALAMSLEVHGEMHTRTGAILNNIGLLHIRRDAAPEAQEALRRSVAIRRVVLGDRHRNTLSTSANLAAALLLGGQAARAEALAREVVQAQREIELPDAVMVGSALRTWGAALTALGRFDEAETPLLEAYQVQNDALGTANAQIERDVQALVDLYEAWGDSTQAAVWRDRLGSPTES